MPASKRAGETSGLTSTSSTSATPRAPRSIRSTTSTASRSSAATTASSASSSPSATPNAAAAKRAANAAAAAARRIGGASSPVKTGARSGLSSIPAAGPPVKTMSSPRKMTSSTAPAKEEPAGWGENELLKAYLRIRPAPATSAKDKVEPYIEVISDTEVLMSPPSTSLVPKTASRARAHALAPPTKYAFSKVFGAKGTEAPTPATPSTGVSQADFFKETTLPMVRDVLHGQSGLVWTYGVTNSGKSYTVSGGPGAGEAGILPRSIDVVFNSVEGLHSDSDIRPVGLTGVERATEPTTIAPPTGVNPFAIPGVSKKLLSDALVRSFSPAKSYERDSTALPVDRNYRYSVWVSYVEVYNEKIFDLLDVAPTTAGNGASVGGGMTSAASSTNIAGMTRAESFRGGSNWSIAAMAGGSGDSAPGSITLQRRNLELKNDLETGGKYVAGMREIRVRTADEAKEWLRRGQENRAVFGTIANRASSRSHGVFTIKIIREHAGEMSLNGSEALTTACSTSRLLIVDLAGSERLANTEATGDRRREAGNINKSLMCLGQCLETLRKNQARAAACIPKLEPLGSASTGRKASDSGASSVSRPRKEQRLSVVPFRHSRLTQLFQSFFIGEGKAVMIVNANPYDTGFDENSHVMKFSAIAREVSTFSSQPNGRVAHLRSLFSGGKEGTSSLTASPSRIPSPIRPPMKNKGVGDGREAHTSDRAVQAPAAAHAQAKREAHHNGDVTEITIVEASDSEDSADSDDEPADPFVDYLMQQHEELRQRLADAELRCAMVESEVRREMADEMAERLAEMETMYFERLASEAEMNEAFVNRKIDLVVRANEAQHQRFRAKFDMTPRRTPSGGHDDLRTPRGLQDIDEAERSMASTEGTNDDDDDEWQSAADESSGILQPGPVRASSNSRSMARASLDGDASGVTADYDEDEDEDEEEENDSRVDSGDDLTPNASLIDLGLSRDEVEQEMDEEDEGSEQGEEEDSEELSDEEEDGESEGEGEEGEEEDLSSDAVEEADSDSSFDVTKESDESIDEPPVRTSRNPRRSSAAPAKRASVSQPTNAKQTAAVAKAAAPRQKTTAATTTKRSAKKSDVALKEQNPNDVDVSASSSAAGDETAGSDASLVLAPPSAKGGNKKGGGSPKKKRVLRKQAALDEEGMVDEVGDSSLAEAIRQRSSTTSSSSNSLNRDRRSTVVLGGPTPRKSLR